ncbi:MAG TPA: alpha/beta hydrolase [Xanthobacteraceae bacterium]|jgi:hypothetical protein
MVSAGSGIPNISHGCDFPGTRATRWWRRGVSICSALAVLPCLLQGCGNADTKSLARHDPTMPSPPTGKGDILLPAAYRTSETMHPIVRDTFADRYAMDSFADRYSATFGSRPVRVVASSRINPLPPGSYRVASLSPELPYAGLPALKQAQTHLVGFENSAFPYFGKNPRSGGGAYAQGTRYGDNRVLVHVPAGFDVRKPGVIVVFFHGHGATLERDVRDRQLLPKQITESGVNAVLLAPQLAYDAADSSAGKFWERGGLKRFLAESADQLARAYGDPRASEAFARMPVVLVGYSGGFVSTAYSLQVGGAGNRIIGVVLLDALYGEMDKFSSWIIKNRSAFFVSAYTQGTKRHDDELARILRDKGIPVADELNGPLKPGSVAFLSTGEGIRHRDYVTLAWTQHPVKDILMRMRPRLSTIVARQEPSGIAQAN